MHANRPTDTIIISQMLAHASLNGNFLEVLNADENVCLYISAKEKDGTRYFRDARALHNDGIYLNNDDCIIQAILSQVNIDCGTKFEFF